MATARDSEDKARLVGDLVCFSIANGIRIAILTVLNQGVHSEIEISRHLRLPQSTVHHHVAKMRTHGSIGETEGRRVRNLTQRRYRALRISECSAEDYRRMGEDERLTTMGFTLQNATAEHLAAFRSGAMSGEDPNVMMNWGWVNVDDQGQEELTEELAGHWKRVREIATRSKRRRAASGKPGRSVVVSAIAHPRVRPGPDDKALGSFVSPADEDESQAR